MLESLLKMRAVCTTALTEQGRRLPQLNAIYLFWRWTPQPLFGLLLMSMLCVAGTSSLKGQTISTVAGTGIFGSIGDGKAATSARLASPTNIAVDGAGNIYIADKSNHRVRKVSYSTGIITTVAGTGKAGFTGDGGPATAAQLNEPYGVAIDESGNLFISDLNNSRIRKVSSKGTITTIAGIGTNGYSGDGGLAIAAQLNTAISLAVDKGGNLFVADASNHRIRKINAEGIISTVAGTGIFGSAGDGKAATSARLAFPSGVAVDQEGTIYIADQSNERIRKVLPSGTITTIAGIGSSGFSGDNGPAKFAELNTPASVAVDGAGNVFVAEYDNSRIRLITAEGIISTIAGTGENGYSGDGGTAVKAKLQNPYGVAVDKTNGLFIADRNNNSIRKVTFAKLTATITSSAGSSGSFTNNSPVPFTVTFSDVVVDFAKTDIIVTGGTLANFAGSGTTYTFTVIPTKNGVVTVDLPAGIAKNAAATPNMAASQFNITYQQPVTAMPIIVTPINGSTDNPAKPIYAGTALANASVNVFVDEQLVGTPTTNNVGKWSLTQPTVLVSGPHKVYAIAQSSGWAASLPSVTTIFTVMSGNANLSSLLSSGGALIPAFSPATTMYTTVVDGSVQSTELTPIIDDKHASLKINGVAAISSNTVDIPLSVGDNTITIEVTAQDGTTKTYTLIVTRNQGDQTITFNAIPEKVYGDAEFKLGASASSGLPINYESGNPSIATIDAAGNVQIIKAGTVEFTAAQKGDGSYAAATSVKQTLVVKPAPLTIQANNQCTSGSDLPKLTLTYTGFVKGETALNLIKQPTVTTTATAESKAGSYPIIASGAESDNYATNYIDGTLTIADATLSASGSITCKEPTVTLTATGGASYALSDGQTNKTGEFAVSKEGEYTVTVMTAEGCVATGNVTVLAFTSAPQVALTNDGPITCAKSTVTLTASPTVSETYCGKISYAYTGPGLVDPKASFGTTTVNAVGVYSVTLTDDFGCTATAETTVGVDKEVPTVTLTSDGALSCTKTSVLLTATGGVSFEFGGDITFKDGNTAIVTKAGTYSVKAKAANGCTASRQIVVTGDQAVPTAGLTDNGPLTCDQPAVTLTASGGKTYQFSTGATVLGENTATVREAGVYSVTITAPNGCTAVAAITVTGDQLAPTAELTNNGLLTCGQPTVTLTATGKGSYRFSQGANQIESGNTATVSTAGVYSVTVTAVNGCTAVAQTTVKANTDLPVASLSSSGPLTCAKPTATLTASGTGSYRFSPGAVQINSSNTATVETAGVYSVTVTSENGCAAVATTSVELNSEIKAPTLTASALVTEKMPIQVTASGCAGTINWTIQGGTGVADGTIYTLAQPANYTLTARCTVGTCTSTDATPLLVSIRPGDFAIASVNTVNCQLVDASRGEYWVTFTPIYSGLSGNPASFSIINEIVSTTATAPYTVRLYADNPVVTLVATQANGSQAQFAYSWRAICTGNVTTNRAPVVTTIPDQQLVQDQPYQLDLTAYFADPDGQTLTFTTSQLPAGLNLSGGRISGRPTGPGVSNVTVTALDPAGLEVSTSVRLRVTAASEPPIADFAITGVSNVTCVALSASERRVSFSPLYSGLNGTSIRFRVVNEIDATTDAGPYAIRLYTDNPVVKLEAVQSGVTATYSYAWLSTCDTPTPTPTPTPQTNRPPVVAIPLVTQTATVGQGYSLYISRNTFTDPDDGALILTAEGLPAGLSYSTSLSAVTGTPASVGTSTIWITATDPGGLSVRTSFELTVKESTVVVNPPTESTPPTADFAITGVSNVTCVALSASERRVSFSPLYSGLNGTSIRFRVVNEIDATTDAGPYAIRLYTDNPVVKLEAVQSGVTATYSYAWLSTCDTPTPTPTPTPPTPPVVTTPTTPVATEFTISGVTTVSCEVVTASERRVTFTPQYAGAASGPISFQVVNEVGATTAGGPYTIRLYTDNPVVTLRAEQNAKVASFRYEWLKGCTPNGRQGALEAVRPLAVSVFGNPVVGESAEVVIGGADGQALQVQVVDLVGNVVYQQSIPRASASERLSVPLGRSQGLLLLHVSTPSQRQQIKLIRP